MTRARRAFSGFNHLTATTVLYLLFSIWAWVAPEVVVAATLLLFPVVVAAVVISLFYMTWVYRRMTSPRPAFFRMLLGSSINKTTVGIALGVAVLALPAGLQRGALIGVSVLVLLTPPIWYALTIWVGRRRAGDTEFDTPPE